MAKKPSDTNINKQKTQQKKGSDIGLPEGMTVNYSVADCIFLITDYN